MNIVKPPVMPPTGNDHALFVSAQIDARDDRVRAVLHRSRGLLGDPNRARREVHELLLVAEQPVLLLGQSHDHVVVQWIDVVFPRLLFEDRLKFGELLGVLLGQVGALREVLGRVVEVPNVLLERKRDVDQSQGMRLACSVTAFQPSTQIARLPNIS